MTAAGIRRLLVVAASAYIAAAVRAEPEPSPAPVAWELNFKPSQLERITAPDRSGRQRTYWYLIYRVINNTGQDVDFLPAIERVSEIDSEIPADQAEKNPQAASQILVDPAITGIDPSVFRAIKQRHARTYPLLVSPVDVIGRIRQGIDNSRDSVAVFPELDPRVSRFTIYVGGLSGERITRPNPMYRKPAGEARTLSAEDPKNLPVFVLQKTLALPYSLPGDVNTRRYATPELGRPTWVMR